MEAGLISLTKGAVHEVALDGNHSYILKGAPGMWYAKKRFEIVRTLKEWEAIKGLSILDWNGFDRSDEDLFEKLFSEAEFDKGSFLCTQRLNPAEHRPDCSKCDERESPCNHDCPEEKEEEEEMVERGCGNCKYDGKWIVTEGDGER
jgi:hypothetical protein